MFFFGSLYRILDIILNYLDFKYMKEELKTRPDFEKLGNDYILTPRYDDNGHKGSFISGYKDCWTTHVEPLQAENEKLHKLLHDHNNMCQGKLTEQLNSMLPELRELKSENKKLREQLKSLMEIGFKPKDSNLIKDTEF